ncbi:MAG: hypothetical protein ACOVMN_09890 [Flexibacteraceae bacterium]
MANSYLQNLQVMRAQVIAEHEETLKSIDSLIARFGTTTASASPVAVAAATAPVAAASTGGKRGRPKKDAVAAASVAAPAEPKAPKAPKAAKSKKPKSPNKIRLNMSDVAAFTASALTAEPKTKNEIAGMYINHHGLPVEFTAQIERGVYITLMEMEKTNSVNTQKLASDARIKLYSKK